MALPELESLELALGELLSALKADESTPEQLRVAWERCSEVEGGVDGAVERARAGGADEVELREALERLVRLNAIVRQAVVAQQDRLASSLVSTRDSGAQLRGYAPAEPSAGGACDMAG